MGGAAFNVSKKRGRNNNEDCVDFLLRAFRLLGLVDASFRRPSRRTRGAGLGGFDRGRGRGGAAASTAAAPEAAAAPAPAAASGSGGGGGGRWPLPAPYKECPPEGWLTTARTATTGPCAVGVAAATGTRSATRAGPRSTRPRVKTAARSRCPRAGATREMPPAFTARSARARRCSRAWA